MKSELNSDSSSHNEIHYVTILTFDISSWALNIPHVHNNSIILLFPMHLARSEKFDKRRVERFLLKFVFSFTSD